MIIFGTTGLKKNVGGGSFYCPQCSAPAEYEHIDVRQFFTLYFIPLIPMGSGGEFIRCRGCAGTFNTDTINYDPVVARDETTQIVRQICVAVLNDMDRCKPNELLALCDVLGDAAGIDIEPEDVAADVMAAQQADLNLIQYLRQQAIDFSEQGKWLVLVIIRRVLESGGGIDPLTSQRLHEIAKALGLRKKHVTEFLENPLLPQAEAID